MDENEKKPVKSQEKVIREDGRYHPDAFAFLHDAMSRAVSEIHGDKAQPGGHVTGQQLCMSLRDLAIERWGMMAPAVLRKWGVTGSIDFGNMVYLLIENRLMRKTDEDSVEDFRNVFNLDRDFDISGRIRMKE